MTVEEFIAAVAPVRQAKIFHAAQLRDFETYVERGYVVPRGELFERPPSDYTPFGSDQADVDGNHANDFFGNLLDQGFSSNYGGFPNIYGPITLVFNPSALRNSRSNEVNVRKAIWSAQPEARATWTTQQLRDCYNSDGYTKVGELQIVGGTLPLSDLAFVIVSDSDETGNGPLITRVRALLENLPGREDNPVRVYLRQFNEQGRAIYASLTEWASGVVNHGGQYDTLPANVLAKFDSIPGWKYGNIKRFADYLDHGTLSRLRDEYGHLDINVAADLGHEEYDYDDSEDFLARITSLHEEQLYERDELMRHVERAEFHLNQARLDPDAEERASRIDNAWDEYVEAVEALNEWIEETRKRILAGQDDLHERFHGSHDGQMSWNLSAWADQFEPIAIPTFDVQAKEYELLDWRKVADYDETGW